MGAATKPLKHARVPRTMLEPIASTKRVRLFLFLFMLFYPLTFLLFISLYIATSGTKAVCPTTTAAATTAATTATHATATTTTTTSTSTTGTTGIFTFLFNLIIY
jgi:hypothetical protein